jgi:glycosyltransferase involved in cell wall biosynthesis
MIQALVSLGHDVHLVSYGDISGFPAHKHIGWSVSRLCEQGAPVSERETKSVHRWIAKRWMRYWGIPSWVPASIDMMIHDFQPDRVIVVGQQALPLAALIRGVPAVWYAADDWVLHHLTLAGKGLLRDRMQSLQTAMLCLGYERSLSLRVGGAVAVSKKDRKALRYLGGFKQVGLVPNGVDAEFFQPKPEEESNRPSICFWGRMDFEPNADAITWFCSQIWPLLLNDFPEAELTIVGANPAPAVKELALNRNVKVTGEVDDIRHFAWNSQVVVMPVRIGAGIKNKLLEACAMGKAIVTSQTAVAGLNIKNQSSEPWIVASNIEDWIKAIKLLWSNRKIREKLGGSARDYVLGNHSWGKAAEKFVDFTRNIK